MGERADRCENCQFWEYESGGDREEVMSGECRRRSPSLVLIQVPELFKEHCSIPGNPDSFDPDPEEMNRRVWPLTYEYDWCGEFRAKPACDEKLTMPIERLKLSTRAAKALMYDCREIKTVGQLIAFRADDLLNEIRNFGETSLKEVQDRLAELGLKLKDD